MLNEKGKYIGLNLLKVEGSNFETGYGYSKFVKSKIDEKSYVPVLAGIANTFGVKNWKDRTSDKIFCRIGNKKDCIELYSKSSDIELNNPFVAGAPTLRLGEGIWGPFSGFELGKAKNYEKINSSIKWKFNAKRGFSDFSYDIWLTERSKSRNSEKNDVEIMVVLSSNFPFPWKKIDESEKFIIQYKNKNNDPNFKDKGHVIVFILKRKVDKFSFDIMELIKYSSKKLKLNLNNYYIRSIDLINEFSKNTEAKVKILNLKFDFKKRGGPA